jgi:hypothetical protein
MGDKLSTSPCFFSDDTLGFRYSDATGLLSAGLMPLGSERTEGSASLTADTYISSLLYTSNSIYGASKLLEVGGGFFVGTKISLLQFNVEHSNSMPAKLRLFVETVGPAASTVISVARMQSRFSLNERTAAWSNTNLDYAAIGRFNLKVNTDQIKKWVEVDVSDLIIDGTLTLALSTVESILSNGVSFSSKEATGYAPVLIFGSVCAEYKSSTESILNECNLDNINQRWIYYNDQFYLSNDSSKKLKVSGTDRWVKGSKLPYLPYSISLTGSQTLHSPLCLEDKSSSLVLQYCADTSNQQWAMSDGGLIKNLGSDRCFSRDNPGSKSPGTLLSTIPCKDADEWHWRDGSLYLDEDEEYLIEADVTGTAIIGYIPNERSRGLHQRWLVGSKRYSTYHQSTNSIRIRNEAAVPLECSLSQVGPLYWGVIYPGR